MFRPRSSRSEKRKLVVTHSREDDDDEDEIVIVASKRAPLHSTVVSTNDGEEEEEDGRPIYSKARIAELKSHSALPPKLPSPTPPPATTAAAAVAPSPLVLSGEDAIKLIQEEEEDASKPVAPSSDDDDDDDDTGDAQYDDARHAPALHMSDDDDDDDDEARIPSSSSSLQSILHELESLQHKLAARKTEFQSILAPPPAAALAPSSSSSTTHQQQQHRLDHARFRRHQLESLKLFSAQLLSCLHVKLRRMTLDSAPPPPTTTAMWSDVKPEFASAQSVAERFAAWYEAEKEEFAQQMPASQLARLLFPYVWWSMRVQHDAFPFADEFECWPELQPAVARFPGVYGAQLAACTALLALQREIKARGGGGHLPTMLKLALDRAERAAI